MISLSTSLIPPPNNFQLLKQIGMLKCIITFYEESQKAIADSPPEKRITWSYIKTTLAHLIQKVQETKFLDPKLPKAEIKAAYDVIVKEIEDGFQALTDA
jgi:V-type H+-transporting ATPase subunit A